MDETNAPAVQCDQLAGAPPHVQAVARHEVLAVYGLHLLRVMTERRHAASTAVLANTGVTEAQLRTRDARLSAAQYATMVFNALRLDGDPALGLELGLRMRLTTHGYLGLALMSCATLGEAIDLGRRYMLARMPFFSFECRREGADTVLEVREAVTLGPLRQFAHEMFLAELCGVCKSLLEDERRQRLLLDVAELCFEHAEPPYFGRYRSRLPRARFGCAVSHIRFPAQFLDEAIHSANPVAVEMATAQCERELALLGPHPDMLERVRALLGGGCGSYPGLRVVAAQLAMSPSSLKRCLRHCGTTFIELRDEARRRDSLRLLGNTTLPVERVANLLGYSDPANFTRAFRRWTGRAPSRFRAETRQGAAAVPIRQSRRSTA
ncbi:MAG: AraC family transcriptional regulator [Pseudomonadota bacterium]|nr:AraC family transcriptional regulator [Pseudomonadota bacterium]